mgnify:CR=1 FL=1
MHSLFDDKEFEVVDVLKIRSLGELIEPLVKKSDWSKVFQKFMKSEEFTVLNDYLVEEYSRNYCFPKPSNIFKAFNLTPLTEVKVIILGQDPYHGLGQADGLAFSLKNGLKTPPSLRNILAEMNSDLGSNRVSTDLTDLAKQGVLLLNTCLTVRNSEAGSHKGRGWKKLIDLILKELNNGRPKCFILWGKEAEKFGSRLEFEKHKVFKSAHPSPLSAYRGFFNSKPFSNVNKALIELGRDEINWVLNS